MFADRGTGFETLQARIRADGQRVPVLFLTARDAVDGPVRGFDVGRRRLHDETVQSRGGSSPASMRVLVEPQVTRRGIPSPGVCGSGVGRGNARGFAAQRPVSIQLSPTEFSLLRYLLLNSRKVLSKAQILDHVWQYDFAVTDESSRRTSATSARRSTPGPPADPHAPRASVTPPAAGGLGCVDPSQGHARDSGNCRVGRRCSGRDDLQSCLSGLFRSSCRPQACARSRTPQSRRWASGSPLDTRTFASSDRRLVEFSAQGKVPASARHIRAGGPCSRPDLAYPDRGTTVRRSRLSRFASDLAVRPLERDAVPPRAGRCSRTSRSVKRLYLALPTASRRLRCARPGARLRRHDDRIRAQQDEGRHVHCTDGKRGNCPLSRA